MAVPSWYRAWAWVVRQGRNLVEGVGGIVGRPSLAFFRLAEEGGRLWPVVVSGLAGLGLTGAQPLKSVVIATLGGRPGCLPWCLAAFVILFPLYYAGSVAGFASVGWLLGARRTGLGWRELYWRVWRVLGWSNLPILIFALGSVGYFLAAGRLAPMWAVAVGNAVPATIPSFTFSFPNLNLLANLMALWVVYLAVLGLRQAFASSTWRAHGALILAGLLFGLLVHTPIARGLFVSFLDANQALGRGIVSFSVNLQAYRFPGRHLPAIGDLVAYSGESGASTTPGDAAIRGGQGVRFVIMTPVGSTFQVGRRGSASVGRVVGLPGDSVAVREGVLFRGSLPIPEDYLEGLAVARAHPPGLTLEATTVPEGSVFVLPDDRTVLESLPGEAGSVISAAGLIGKVVSVQFYYAMPAQVTVAGGRVIQPRSWPGIILWLALFIGFVIGTIYLLGFLGPRLFRPRCPKCRTPFDVVVRCVYEGETRPEIVLPKVNLITRTCPSCGHEERFVDPDASATFFERGPKTKWPDMWPNRPEDVRPVVRAVLEWDKMYVGLMKEYDATTLNRQTFHYGKDFPGLPDPNKAPRRPGGGRGRGSS